MISWLNLVWQYFNFWLLNTSGMSHLLTSITFNIDMSDQEYWRKNLFVKVSVFLRSLVSKFLHNFYIIFCLTFQSDKCFWHNTNFPDDLLGELLSCRTKKLFLIILVILGLISYFRWLVFLWLIFQCILITQDYF